MKNVAKDILIMAVIVSVCAIVGFLTQVEPAHIAIWGLIGWHIRTRRETL